MSDEQNHNDPLERLFRKKAEEYNISYREEDWLNLEKKLDARDMKLYYRRRLRWLAAASFLILSLLGYFTLQNYNRINELAGQFNQTEEVEQTEPSANDPDELDGNPGVSSNQTEPVQESPIEEEFAERGIDDDLYEEPVGQTNPQNLDTRLAVASTAIEENQTGGLTGRDFAEANQVISRKPLDPVYIHSELAMHPDMILKRDWIQLFWLAERQPEEEGGWRRIELKNSTLAMMEDESPYSSSTLAMNADRSSHSADSPSSSRFAIGIVISPDLSTVGTVSNFYDPGFKGGLLAEYSLSKNISLISGVTVSNVKYKAVGSSYNPPQALNYGAMPDETTAVCLILDIPLNLKANLFNFNRSRIFATAGLSSYVMLNEDYQFSYEDDSPGLQSSWSDRTGTRHWFSNAGFSVGIEYDLSPTWSIRAEPHIKVPLKGVGWGDVELYSMGSFVSLNYRFGSP